MKQIKANIKLRDLKRIRYMYDFLTSKNNGEKFVNIVHFSKPNK